MDSIAKVFQNGRSQAIRLPKAFRFKGSEVIISKKGDMVILEPLGSSLTIHSVERQYEKREADREPDEGKTGK